MKLRNKKSGEIIETYPDRFVINSGEQIRQYDSLAKLNADWEDVPKEPKEYYTIDWSCTGVTTNKYSGDDIDDFNKSIGNYFETKEEAEKAVEKLKAWKRLKEARFEFSDFGYDLEEESSSLIGADGKICFNMLCYEDFSDDLELLFGGEE